MSTENRNFLILATLAAAGAGFAWFHDIFGYDNDGDTNHPFRNLLAKHAERGTIATQFATLEVCNKYKDLATSFGFTLKDALVHGLANHTGFMAGDEGVYKLFPKVLDPLIFSAQNLAPRKQDHHNGIDGREFECDALDVKYVLSCRARVVRSLRGYPFAWRCSVEERSEIEDTAVKKVLGKLPGYANSRYVKLSHLDAEERDHLIEKHYVFKKYVNGASKSWPEGRGIWYSNPGNTVVLVNEQEHLKFITQHSGNNIRIAFRELRCIVQQTERLLRGNGNEFLFEDRYGYLTSSPRETGTGFRVSLNVRLPRLVQEPRLAFILHLLLLEKRPAGIVTSQNEGVMELSNFARAGHREIDFLKQVLSNISCLIAMEKRLEEGRLIDSILCELLVQQQRNSSQQ